MSFRSFPRRYVPPYPLAHAPTRVVQAAQVDGLCWRVPARAGRFPQARGSCAACTFVSLRQLPASDDCGLAHAHGSFGHLEPRVVLLPRSGLSTWLVRRPRPACCSLHTHAQRSQQRKPPHGRLPPAPRGRIRRRSHRHPPARPSPTCLLPFDFLTFANPLAPSSDLQERYRAHRRQPCRLSGSRRDAQIGRAHV